MRLPEPKQERSYKVGADRTVVIRISSHWSSGSPTLVTSDTEGKKGASLPFNAEHSLASVLWGN